MAKSGTRPTPWPTSRPPANGTSRASMLAPRSPESANPRSLQPVAQPTVVTNLQGFWRTLRASGGAQNVSPPWKRPIWTGPAPHTAARPGPPLSDRPGQRLGDGGPDRRFGDALATDAGVAVARGRRAGVRSPAAPPDRSPGVL